MRRYPLFLIACLCWLLVLLVPATRHHLFWSWQHPRNDANYDYVAGGSAGNYPNSPFTRSLAEQFPRDDAVALYIAQQYYTTSYNQVRGADYRLATQTLAKLAQREPNNPSVSALQLRLMRRRWSNRYGGKISNPKYPAPPMKLPIEFLATKAELQALLAVARQGQKLEPNNVYFDIQLMYGLYALYRDDEARTVLSRAASKTGYDAHKRDLLLNQIAVLKRYVGSPVSARLQLLEFQRALGYEEGFRELPRWIMEDAIEQRGRGRHNVALNMAFDAVKIGRTIRGNAYNASEWSMGQMFEGIVMANAAYYPLSPPLSVPLVRWSDPLPIFQTNPRGLYSYAKSQGRTDITKVLESDRSTLTSTPIAKRSITTNWIGTSLFRIGTLAFIERLMNMILNALPAILILWAVFAGLSRYFRDDSGVPDALQKGALWGALLLLFAMACDAVLVLRGSRSAVNPNLGNFSYPSDWWWRYQSDLGLVDRIPAWINYGFGAALLCVAVASARAWQREQNSPSVPFVTRIKSVFVPPEDGLARFDLSWILGLSLRLTIWLVGVGSLFFCCWNAYYDSSIYSVAPIPMGLATSIYLSLQLIRWWTQKQRAATMRLSFRLIAQSMAGCFVVVSLCYALAALVWLPLTLQFNQNLETAIQKGEAKFVLSEIGL